MERNLVIAHVVVSDAFAGVEKYVCDVAHELARRGHCLVVVGGDGGRMVPALGAGIKFCSGDTFSSALRNALTVGPIDVIHAHMTKSELVGIVTSFVRRCPVVATRHFAHGRGIPSAVDRLLRAGLTAELAVSEHVALSCPTTTDTVVSGVPVAQLVEAREKVVLVAQRLEREKFTADAIAAWARSFLADDGWTMVIAGAGSESSMLAELAGQLGVAGSVRFDGFVSDVASVRARVGFQVATTPNESFGLSVAEAMAAGLPVVAAAGGGHLELLADSPELLYPPGDVESLASVMRRLAGDESLRRRLGRELQNAHRNRYTLTNHVDGLERVYRRVTQ